MGRRLREEEVMTIEVLHERGCSNREIARKLGIRENAVRYRLARLASGASDGRSDKPFQAESLHVVIAHWLERSGEARKDFKVGFRISSQVVVGHATLIHSRSGRSRADPGPIRGSSVSRVAVAAE
jgi:hypothetical protein